MSSTLDPKNKDNLDSLIRDALRDHEKVIGHYINLVDFLVERIVKDVTDWHTNITAPPATLFSEDGEDEKFFQQTSDVVEFSAKADVDMSGGTFTIYDKEFKK